MSDRPTSESGHLTESELDLLREAHWPGELEGEDGPFRRQARFEHAVAIILGSRLAQAEAVESAMAHCALLVWRSATARAGLSDHEALRQYADAMTRWSERLRMALSGALTGDEEWMRNE